MPALTAPIFPTRARVGWLPSMFPFPAVGAILPRPWGGSQWRGPTRYSRAHILPRFNPRRRSVRLVKLLQCESQRLGTDADRTAEWMVDLHRHEHREKDDHRQHPGHQRLRANAA